MPTIERFKRRQNENFSSVIYLNRSSNRAYLALVVKHCYPRLKTPVAKIHYYGMDKQALIKQDLLSPKYVFQETLHVYLDYARTLPNLSFHACSRCFVAHSRTQLPSGLPENAECEAFTPSTSL